MNNIDIAKGITDNYKSLANHVGGFSAIQKRTIIRMSFDNMVESMRLSTEEQEQIYGFISRNLHIDF